MCYSLKLELNLFLTFLAKSATLYQKKPFPVKKLLVHLADKPVANLIKAKSMENTNLNRQWSFMDSWHFVVIDANVGGWMGLNL